MIDSGLGKSPIEANELIECLRKHKLTKTPKLMKCLDKLAESKKLKSFYNDAKRSRHAFWLDYLWWEEGFGTRLAAESEISDRSIKGIQHDFEKLLCWKAPLKLMIVKQQGKRIKPETIAKELSQYATDNFRQHLLSETYVLIIFGRNEESQAFVAGSKTNFKFQIACGLRASTAVVLTTHWWSSPSSTVFSNLRGKVRLRLQRDTRFQLP